MTDLFEKLAPQWSNAVKEFAFSLWYGRGIDKAAELYDERAERFSRRYRRALEEHYALRGLRVYRGTLDGKVNEWMAKQTALRDTLPQMIYKRQQDLVAEEIERLKDDESYTAQQTLNKLYEARKGENVYKVFTFADNYGKKAEQLGDENAYDLGSRLNEEIIGQFSDRYIWRTQRDRRVRETHKKLAGKCFLFDDPPTTVTKSGRVHTGNPGTDWGCRCWADIPDKNIKPLRGYIVHEH